MTTINDSNTDEETISKIGLRLSHEAINAQVAHDSRVFEYPGVPDVFIMESDLYGNLMPKGSCFLAFTGLHGLVGKHLKVEVLMNSSADDIKDMVTRNNEG